MVDEFVRAFCTYFEAEQIVADDVVAEYLATTITITPSNELDIEELCDVLEGHGGAFEKLDRARQRELMNGAVVAVRASMGKCSFAFPDRTESIASASLTEVEASVSSQEHLRAEAVPATTQQLRNDEGVQTLQSLCDNRICPAFAQHILEALCGGNVEIAANWVLECHSLKGAMARWEADEKMARNRVAEEALQEKLSKRRTLQRYGDEEVKRAPAVIRIPKGGAEPKTRVRYRDGVPIANKGEKYVFEQVKPEDKVSIKR